MAQSGASVSGGGLGATLIQIINELQEVFLTATGNSDVQLPQIVVVGAQSSGKSSVLESLVGKSFLPRGSGLVTRCPTILRLIHVPSAVVNKTDGLKRETGSGSTPLPNVQRKVKSKGNGSNGPQGSHADPSQSSSTTGSPEEWCVFSHAPDTKYTDFDKVREEIYRRTDERAGINSNIITEPIQLTVYSPNVITLTLVDLPGIVKVRTGDQPEDIEQQINGLIGSYIENPNAIILAVSAATNDMATSESIKFAQEADPDGDRTIAVITKLDLMDRGTDATQVLMGNVIPVKLGIIGVVNRSQEDIVLKKCVEDALRDEAKFLERNYHDLAKRNGTPYLAKRLNKLLLRHIDKCFPALEVRIRRLLQEKYNVLGGITGANMPEEKESIMLELISRFCTNFTDSIFGNSKEPETERVVGGAKILEICHTSIDEQMEKLSKCEKTTEQILIAIKNSKGFGSTIDPQVAFQSLVKLQIAGLKKPLLDCTNSLYEELNIIVRGCLTSEFRRFPKFQQCIIGMMNKMWTDRFKEFRQDLEKYILIESRYINIRHEQFVTQYEAFQKQLANQKFTKDYDVYKNKLQCGVASTTEEKVKLPNSEEQLLASAQLAKKLIEIYFGIVILNSKDHFIKSLAHHTIYYATDNLSKELIRGLHKDDKIDELMEESDDIVVIRNQTMDMIQRLERAMEIIENTRSIAGCEDFPKEYAIPKKEP